MSGDVAQTAPFEWTPRREEAALLLAAGDLTGEQIGDRVGVTTRTLERWKHHGEFRARIDRHRAALREAVITTGIADRVARVAALDDQFRRMTALIEARADDPSMADVPGGPTGLLVRDVKIGGRTVVDVYAFDAALLRERRETMKQAAQELGQWAEKTEITGAGGGPVRTESAVKPDLSRLSMDELRALRDLIARTTQPE